MSTKFNDITMKDIKKKRIRLRKRRKRRRAIKVFILTTSLITMFILGTTTILENLNDTIVQANADTLENKKEEKNEDYIEIIDDNINGNIDKNNDDNIEIDLDNSGYLTLENDINADDASVVLPETMHKWNFYREDGRKIAYLTFDDGPSSEVTPQILDILEANDVKATFFVTGKSIENNPKSSQILKRIARKGHAIGNHGYSHDYNILYPNGVIDVSAFMNDMEKNLELLKSILGKDFNTRVLRMPGGYGTWYGVTPLNAALKEKGYYQTDWNSLNGDAEGKLKGPEEMLDTLKATVLDYDTLIVLMHDTNDKKATVEYLQSAIHFLKSEGFEFRTLK